MTCALPPGLCKNKSQTEHWPLLQKQRGEWECGIYQTKPWVSLNKPSPSHAKCWVCLCNTKLVEEPGSVVSSQWAWCEQMSSSTCPDVLLQTMQDAFRVLHQIMQTVQRQTDRPTASSSRLRVLTQKHLFYIAGSSPYLHTGQGMLLEKTRDSFHKWLINH